MHPGLLALAIAIPFLLGTVLGVAMSGDSEATTARAWCVKQARYHANGGEDAEALEYLRLSDGDCKARYERFQEVNAT